MPEATDEAAPGPADREPVQSQGEESDQQQADPETGQPEPNYEGSLDAMINPAFAVGGGDHSQRDAEHYRDHHAVEHKKQSGRQPRAHKCVSGLVQQEGVSEMPTREPGNEVPVLPQQ